MSTLAYYEPNPAEQRLVAALRSGRYTQITGALERFLEGCRGEPVGNCCLGVGCREFADDLHLKVSNFGGAYVKFDDNGCFLPSRVQAMLGWAHDAGFLDIQPRNGACRYTLIGLNDDGFTFDQIADIIEAGLVLHAESS